MKFVEYEAKDLLRAAGVAVPPNGGVVSLPQALAAALKKAGKAPWVLKVQVLAGGRGKAGGIKLVKTPAQAREALKAMLGMTLKTHQTGETGIKVKEILVEGGIQIERELYFSVLVDRKTKGPMIVASAQGGMEIEEVAAKNPKAVLHLPVDVYAGLRDFEARRLAFELGVPPEHVGSFVRTAKALTKLFLAQDLSLLEVNPLALTPKGFVALDAKVISDDNASFRHPETAKMHDYESSAAERQAKAAELSYIGLDGNIGCLVNGAGLAMGTMDTIDLAGGRPANFLDVGGGADEERVTKAFQIILKDKNVKAILVNIFGGIVKCDVIAAGILAAVKKTGLKVPLVVRLQGTNVEAGRKALRDSKLNLISAEGLWEAAQKAVAAAQKAGAI